VLLAILALTACDQSVIDPQPGNGLDPARLATAELQIVSGDWQEGVVGSSLADPLTVVVLDADGNPIAGAPVTWTFGSGRGGGHGSPTRNTITTLTADYEGLVVVDWELGTTAGLQLAWAEVGSASTVTAEDALAATSPAGVPKDGRGQSRGRKVRFDVTSAPAAPAKIVVSPTSLTLQVGQSVDLTAAVFDQFGNEIPGAVVEWTSSDPSIVSVGSPAAVPSLSLAMAPKPATIEEGSREAIDAE